MQRLIRPGLGSFANRGHCGELKNANSDQARGNDGSEKCSDRDRQWMSSLYRCRPLQYLRRASRIAVCKMNGVVAKLLAQGGQIARQFNLTVGRKRRFIG